MTKRLPRATKWPSFYWYWPNTCVRLSNVLDESGPDGPTSMWFYNNLLFGQTTNNGERNSVLPFGDWKIDLELPNSMENNAIDYHFPKEWVKDLCLFCALIKDEDLISFRMDIGQDSPLQISWKVTQIWLDLPSWREKLSILFLLFFNILLMRFFCKAGKLCLPTWLQIFSFCVLLFQVCSSVLQLPFKICRLLKIAGAQFGRRMAPKIWLRKLWWGPCFACHLLAV